MQDFLEVLQLSRYKETDCSISSFPYFPQNERGWNTGNFLNLLLFFRFGVELPGQTRWCYGVIMQLLIYLHKVYFMVEIQNVCSYDKSMDSVIDILVSVMLIGIFGFFRMSTQPHINTPT